MKSRIFSLWLFWFLLLTLLLQYPTRAHQELGAPFIRNYYPQDFGGQAQNWAIVQDKRGVMYFGCGGGYLLEFDGRYWNKCAYIPNRSNIRSLDIDDKGRIYVGATNELGYAEPDEKGQIKYYSLTDKIDEADRAFGDVWRLYATSHGVYYITNLVIFRYFKGKIEVIRMEQHLVINNAKIGDDVFFLSEGGLFILRKGKAFLLPHTSIFSASKSYTQILPYQEGKILIASEKQGCYLYNLANLFKDGELSKDLSENQVPETILQKLSTRVDDYIRANRNYCGVLLDGYNYAFGTVSGGVIIMDSAGEIVRIINENRGLPNRIVLYLYPDCYGNLWAALNGLISYIETGSPLSFFRESSGLKGTVLSAVRYDNRLYAGDFKGIHYLRDYKPQVTNDRHSFVTFEDPRNKACWCFYPLKGFLLAGGNFGVAGIGPQGVFQKLGFKRTVYCFGQSKRFSDYVFMGLSNPGGLAILKIEPTAPANERLKYISSQNSSTIKHKIKKIINDSSGNLWLTTMYNGIIFVKFRSTDIRDFETFNYTTEHGLPQNDQNKIHIRNGFLIIATQKGIYKSTQQVEPYFDPEKLRFEEENTFGKWFNQNSQAVFEIDYDENGHAWVNAGQSFFKLTLAEDNSFSQSEIPLQKIKASEYDQLFLEKNGITWLCSPKGLYRYDSKIKKNYQVDYPALIRKVTIGKNQIIFYGNHVNRWPMADGQWQKKRKTNSQRPSIKYRNNQVVFEYAAPFFEFPDDTRFSYFLEGMESNWNEWTKDTKTKYTNISEGNYCFKVKAKNIFDHESGIAAYEFTILPPWYRSFLSYTAYIILFFLLMYTGIRLNSRRLIANQKRLEKIVKERTAEVVRQKDEIQKQAEQLEKLSIVASETDNAVLIMDEKGNYEWANKGFHRLYGLSLEELIQKRGPNLVTSSEYKEIAKIFDECVLEKRSIQYEFSSKNVSGEQIWVQTTLTPILDDHGRIFKLVAIDSDISELKRAQKLALRHAHKAGMTDIVINTIHNVGNLLSSAMVSLGLLFDCNKNSSVARYLKANELLQQNIHCLEDFLCHDVKGKRLIEYYIELGKGFQKENQRILKHLEEVDNKHRLIYKVISAQGRYADYTQVMESEANPKELIQDAFTIEAELIKSNAIQVKTNYDSVPAVIVQHNKLIQVLVNLIRNAVEAMYKNSSDRIMNISLTYDNQEIMIKVDDNGHGIEQRNLKRIFNQGFSTRSENRGYGLHDSANFVTEMGGKLTAHSAGPGRGACFIVSLRCPSKAVGQSAS